MYEGTLGSILAHMVSWAPKSHIYTHKPGEDGSDPEIKVYKKQLCNCIDYTKCCDLT